MKKSMVVLAAMATIGAFSTSVLASDVFVNVGYNVAGSSELTLTGNCTSKEEPETWIASGGGGLVITLGGSFDVTDEIGIKTSLSFDHMNKVFENGNSLYDTYDDEADDGSWILVDIPKENWVDLEVDKWTISADLLGSYNLVKLNPNLKAGVLFGANFVSTNAYDTFAPVYNNQEDLDAERDYKDEYDEDGNFSLSVKVKGVGIVAGGFVDYSMNDKLDLNLEGYIGVLNFGDLVNGLSNLKISASAAYEVFDDVNVTVSFTFANVKFNKLDFYKEDPDGSVENLAIEYTYKQLIPSIGVIYNF